MVTRSPWWSAQLAKHTAPSQRPWLRWVDTYRALNSRCQPQVDLTHLGRAHDRARLPFGNFAPEVEHDQTIHHRQQRMHDMLDPDDRHTFGVNGADSGDQLVAFTLDEAAGDLVQQQKFRRRRQRSRHLQPFALQQRESAGRGVGVAQQFRALEYFGAEVARRTSRHLPAVRCRNQQVLEYGHVLERLRDLVGAAYASLASPVRLEHRDVSALEHDKAGIGVEVTGDEIE